jgi:putative redox protein
METRVKWNHQGLEFEGSADSKSGLHLISSQDVGLNGFRPMELMAAGLAGCTAMDVLSILKKKQQEIIDFEVLVHTRNAHDHPQVWEWVQIEYLITGRNIDPQAVERALELSSQKYCPAQNMIKKAVEIELVYHINEVL